MDTFKPVGYRSVSPYLVGSDAAASIRFLEQMFDAKLLRSFLRADGRLMHAELRLDGSVLMLADSAPEWPPVPGYVHVYVSDVDATYASAWAAGATSVQVPVKKGDEDKCGGVRDAGGTTW